MSAVIFLRPFGTCLEQKDSMTKLGVSSFNSEQKRSGYDGGGC